MKKLEGTVGVREGKPGSGTLGGERESHAEFKKKALQNFSDTIRFALISANASWKRVNK